MTIDIVIAKALKLMKEFSRFALLARDKNLDLLASFKALVGRE